VDRHTRRYPRTQKQDLAQAVVAVNDPTRLSDAATSGLRYGAVALGLAGLLVVGLALRRRGRADPA
jgi:hypothetical protein